MRRGTKELEKMFNSQRKIPTGAETDRAERLEWVLEALSEANKEVPVIVEGKRDAMALRELGLTGEIIQLHCGKSLYDFSEDIMESFDRVVLLTDWDHEGEDIYKKLGLQLSGFWEEYAVFREYLKYLCQKDIGHIEGIPKLLRRLKEVVESPGT